MKQIALKWMLITVFMAVWSVGIASAASYKVSGTVTDAETGDPLFAVSVTDKKSSNKVFTDMDGKYSITVEKGSTLEYAFVGYETQRKAAIWTTINVALSPSVDDLEEAMVTEIIVKDIRRDDVKVKHVVMADMEVSDMCYRPASPYMHMQKEVYSTEEYDSVSENRFKWADDDPLSTFSIDVDVASYGNMRRYINQGSMPPADAIRTEELVNYFSYDYAKPTGKDPVKITAETGTCPWNTNHRLVKVAVKAKEIAGDELPASNLVFLIDVSGSMYGPTRLDLVKSSLKLLINNLREKDRVAIVVYSGSAGLVLPSTSGSDKQKIREALDGLTAGGSTAGGAGIKLAYKTAKENLVKGGNNRVILCTDGDFNVGVSSKDGLEQLIEKERESGVFLTVLGYGMGNYKDNKMQTLAEKGNGNHAYIDNLQEANKVLVQEFGGTLYAVAKDVKLQIEFNPEHVQAYRLVGYESRMLNHEDFNDDTKDAGEMGAGHAVTAFYEVIPVGVKANVGGKVDDLKYQKTESRKKPVYTGSRELMNIKLRYKDPAGDVSKKIELPVIDDKNNKTSDDFRFAAAVAMFGHLLRDSDYKADASYDKVLALAKSALGNDDQGYRREFVRLVESAKGLN